MGSLGTTFALFIALAFSSAQVFAAEATQGGGTSNEPSHEGEENKTADSSDPSNPEKGKSPVDKIMDELDALIETADKNPDDQPTLLLDAKETLENEIAKLKEAILNEDDPTKKSALEKTLDKLSKAAEKIANVLTARSNAQIAKIEAARATERAQAKAEAAPVPSTAPVPAAESTHQKTPQLSSSTVPNESRSVPSSNGGSGNRSYAYSDNRTAPVAPRTSTPSGKSSVPQRISSSTASSSPTSTPQSPSVATTPSTPSTPYVAPSTNLGSTPIVSAPARMPASSNFVATAIEMPKLNSPATIDTPASIAAPISRRQAEAAGVSVAPTPQTRLANNAIASADNSYSESSRGITRKNEIGSTKNLYPAIASGSNNAEAPKGTSFANVETYEKAPVYDSKPAANSFYAKTSSARVQGQYIELGVRGEVAEIPAPAPSVTTVAAGEPLLAIVEKPTGPAKFARAAFKPVQTYNSPTVKDPIVEKSKASPDALASKKNDFKNFRENPFL